MSKENKKTREELAEKAKNKKLDHATAKWEQAQLAAAQAAEMLDKSLATVMFYKDELTEEQIEQVYERMREQRAELEAFLRDAQAAYATALDEINLEAVVYEPEKKLVNLEDL
jgi:hypothetical protein